MADSNELGDTLRLCLYCSEKLENVKYFEALLNVVFSASGPSFFRELSAILGDEEAPSQLYKWMASKIEVFMAKGVSKEELVPFTNNAHFKRVLSNKIKEIEGGISDHEEEEGKVPDYGDESAIEHRETHEDEGAEVSDILNHLSQKEKAPYEPLGSRICKALDSDFEKDLLLVKDLQNNNENDPSEVAEAKNLVFNKLLQTV